MNKSTLYVVILYIVQGFITLLFHLTILKRILKVKVVLFILISLSAAALQGAKVDVSKKSCLTIDGKIKKQDSKLRAGYSLKQGEKWKHKLRFLKKQKYACRMKRYPTK